MDLLRGTLDVMVLKSLSWGPLHGYAVIRWIRRRTKGTLHVEDAALYQALHRMERRGWVKSEWGLSEKNRKAKYYRITTAGRRHLTVQVKTIKEYTNAMWEVLEAETA